MGIATIINEAWHEFSNNVLYATSKGLDQTAYMQSLARALDIPRTFNLEAIYILYVYFHLRFNYKRKIIWSFLVKMPHCWTSHVAVQINYHRTIKYT